ncbi:MULTISPECIES: hypothetical protein [unclassified Caballeronia]|uniref:hypothetical protein n=1 Tax=unclassified Caballeronia TaxID=2646786 RepID=UPI0020299288|nr:MULTISPECIES: hypothetical protein [unclassified Caballeronia]
MPTQSFTDKPRSIITKLQRGKKRLLDKVRIEPACRSTDLNHECEKSSLFDSLAIGARVITVDTDAKQTKLAVQNVGRSRIVVLPSVHRFPETQATSIMVMPLMMSLESGECGTIDYVLLTGEAETEQLYRARFEWFQSYPNAATQEAETSIPLIVRPTALKFEDDPCELLSASINKYGDVIIENRSAHIVFLSPLVTLVPFGQTFVLSQRYIAPQSWQLCRGVASGMTPSAIGITIETPTGITTSSLDLHLRPWTAIERSWHGPFE